ncbi:LytTR family DNA-binding domain-containing protein [Telluribacter sp.]|jgi:DNA-binding LytR/AlgR family response regulator|uniref:LytR/AlgR family response regulator transcription factor n=1 Tax=Telluribacter sp. TaxID=1978767 RepID=UPI002E13460D|nr:LytTR family DNA-binding domain-containing protein [Telluribacter sp.]
MAIRCFVLDDEPLATALLASHIGRLPDMDLIGVSHNPTQALKILQQNQVDVLFLDIQMPRLTGFELLRPLGYRPKVIFTTAFREYALDSYEFDAVDFLIKPISFERFLHSVGKIYRFLPTSEPDPSHSLKTGKAYQYFKVNKEMVKIFLEDILWIEGMKDYVKIHTLSGTLVSYLRISYLEEKLPSEQFLRIHKSFIVSLDHVQAVSATYFRIHGIELPIGRSYKAIIEEVLQRK